MKIIRIIATAFVTAFALSSAISVSADDISCHGEKTLGIKGGYAGHNDSGFANLYFQYSFSNHVRIAPEIGYVFKNEQKSALTISADVQFPFRIARGIKIYPLTGLTYNNWNHAGGGSTSKFGADVGGGLDFYMTGNLKLTLEGKYSFMSKTSGVFAGIGIGYVF